MEQSRDRNASPPTESRPITRKQYLEKITVSKADRYALFFLILNTLNFIENGDDYYCYCNEMVMGENGIKKKRRWRSAHCQICKMPCIFVDFEKIIDKNHFNMLVLCKYYDQLFNGLVKLFDQCPKVFEYFLGDEYIYSSLDWNRANTGVFLFQKGFGIQTI